MEKEKSPIQQQLERGIQMGANPNRTPKEALQDVIQTAQEEMQAATDLTSARRQRKEAVAQRLNQLREKSGLRQRDVAEKIGVNVITLSGYEVGRSEPPEEVMVRLADLYEVSLDYLLCRTNTRIQFQKDTYRIIEAEQEQLQKQLENIKQQLQDIEKKLK